MKIFSKEKNTFRQIIDEIKLLLEEGLNNKSFIRIINHYHNFFHKGLSSGDKNDIFLEEANEKSFFKIIDQAQKFNHYYLLIIYVFFQKK